MTPEELNVISDAIKILGPALITGLVGYYSAKIQLMAKLKELDTKLKEQDKNNEFKAREYYFNYYKEQQKEMSGPADAHQTTSLTSLLHSFSQEEPSEDRKQKIQDISKLIVSAAEDCKAQLELRGLNKKPQFSKLVTELNSVNSSKINGLEDITEDFVRGIRDLSMSYGRCIHLIEEKNMEDCFGKYWT